MILIENAAPASALEANETLTLNWIMPRPSLAGGVKSNRLIAEAMVRRGHRVTLAYVDYERPWPSPLRVRSFSRRLVTTVRQLGKQKHHLEQSTAQLINIHHDRIEPDDVPDADFSIGTWWETMEWIRTWPASKGQIAHFIRHYEIFGGDPARVEAVYRIPCLKLVIARWLQRLMAERFNDPNAVLVPNGVDWTQFNSTPRDKNARPTVGLLYSHVKWKGMDTIFDALHRVQKEIPQLKVVAFGNRPPEHESNLPSHFQFHLRPQQETIPQIYRSADCWIMGSTSEGFGMPGLEAAACRCPLVSTRCGGPEDYIRDGENGYLVDVGDSTAMADRILRILHLPNDAWRAMSESSYSIAQQFNWDHSAELLERALLAAQRAKSHAG